ncbi:carboxymuconolactone decarboxylase family protein [Salinisphaera sp. Q1T1-3]|uniref:carboxymuconolactone decarboxylase family protein n=1 Tax=Salinisphaera sp. Q1T1-3 TaxID=2321229 RepID=UPI000E745D05|nr:carboxymuconolactone decarboxylase family protein [Salinisphaera sp. Q1T1-3]RJS93702.1 carboxymuconolactone decarboxylase family protein [Salinisphaera sp. Q1T1-3]
MPKRSIGLGSRLSAVAVALACSTGASAATDTADDSAKTTSPDLSQTPTLQQISEVAPALSRYSRDVIRDDLWQRKALSTHDRALVTVAALIARDQTGDMTFYFKKALDNGVTPAELGEVITQMAFYAGWPNAMDAVNVARPIFEARHVSADQLAPNKPDLAPVDKQTEASRKASVEKIAGQASPGVVTFTNDVLFGDLWRRPVLSPRDRSLVTVVALVATGQAEQIKFHLNRAMDNGLSQDAASEILTQLAFYSGWPKVFSAIPVFKAVFASRSQDSQAGATDQQTTSDTGQ